jgi:hypothetical protein
VRTLTISFPLQREGLYHVEDYRNDEWDEWSEMKKEWCLMGLEE